MYIILSVSTSFIFVLSSIPLFEYATTMCLPIYLTSGLFSDLCYYNAYLIFLWSYVIISLGLLPKSRFTRAVYLKNHSPDIFQI